jgi:acyl-CoA thioester hydrolase
VRPKPFVPEIISTDPCFVRDKTTGKAWHRCEHRTLYIDTDRSQVVYHSNYLRYFELGRATLMRDSKYTYREVEESGFVYPIIEVGLTYHSPLYYDDAMYIHTRPSAMQRVKLRFDYLITRVDTGQIVCIGFTQHCATNRSGTPVEIDPHTQTLWKTFPK